MIGARVLPPNTGSPMRRRCSATRRERFLGLRRGPVVGGLTITSTSPVLVTASMQKQLKIEGELEFANHDDWRLVAAEPHEVAAPDFALDREAEVFEEAFDGQIKRGFQGDSGAACATQCL